MQTIIQWITTNSVFITTITAILFTILTVIILIVSFSDGANARKQIRVLARSIQYGYRPRVLPKYTTVDEKIRCLTFENTGTQYAKNVIISLNSEWLQAKAALPDFQSNNEILRELPGKKLVVAPGERLVYGLYLIGATSVDYFKSQPLKVNIKYTDSHERVRFEDNFVLDLSVFDDQMASGNDFSRGVAKVSEKLDKLETALKDIDYRIYELGALTKRSLELSTKNHPQEDDSKKRKK